MEIRSLEWATMLQSVDQRQFDAVMMAWSMTPDPDPYQVWHSSQSEKGSNYVWFRNQEADQLIEQARVSFSREDRCRMYHRFAEILADEQPYTFMFCPKTLLAISKRIKGVKMYPFGPDATDWYVPTAEQKYGKN
jgi:peptide/nickel transport system substrate-binding protein